MADIHVNLSPPQAVEHFRVVVEAILESQGHLTSEAKVVLENKATQLGVHQLDAMRIIQDIVVSKNSDIPAVPYTIPATELAQVPAATESGSMNAQQAISTTRNSDAIAPATALPAQVPPHQETPIPAAVDTTGDGLTLLEGMPVDNGCTENEGAHVSADIPILPPSAPTTDFRHRGQLLRAFGWHSALRTMRFSYDGTLLAAFSYNNEVIVWHTSTGEIYSVHQFEDEVAGIQFLPSNKPVALTRPRYRRSQRRGFRQILHLCEAGSGRLLCKLGSDLFKEEKRPFSFDVAHQSTQYAVTGHDASSTHMVCLWDLGRWQFSRSTVRSPSRLLKGHNRDITSACYSPFGNLFATTSDDGTLKLWNPTTGQMNRVLKVSDMAPVGSVFSPDGKSVASALLTRNTCALAVWNISSGDLRHTHALPEGRPDAFDMVFSADSKRLSMCKVFSDHTVSLDSLDLQTGVESQIRQDAFSPVCSVFSSDARLHACSDKDGNANLWEIGGLSK